MLSGSIMEYIHLNHKQELHVVIQKSLLRLYLYI